MTRNLKEAISWHYEIYGGDRVICIRGEDIFNCVGAILGTMGSERYRRRFVGD